MADNLTTQSATPATVPASSVIATDDVSGVHFQKVKIDVGGDGASVVLSNSNPLPISDAAGSLTVDGTVAISGTVAVTDNSSTLSVDDGAGSLTVDGTVAATQSGTWNVGTVTTITNVVHVDDNSSTLSIDDGAGSVTVDNGGTFVVQENGAALTALQLIDDTVYTDDTSTHSTGASKGNLIMAAATPTDGSVNANDIGAVAMTTDRKLHVSVQDALPAGTNAIGKLSANSGVDIGDVDITSLVPGTAATSLGKAEDAVHSSGDTGVMMLGVRNDAGTALAADGDYIPLSIDSSGAVRVTGGGGGTQYTEADTDASITGTAMLWEDTSDTLRAVSAAKPLPVNIISGAGSGGTALQDDTAFTVGTTNFTPAGGTYKSTRDSVDDNDGGAFAMNVKRALYTSPESPNGDSIVDDTNDAMKVVNATASNLNATVVGTGTFAVQATLQASTNTQEVVGDAAHDAAVAGNPLLVGFEAKDQDGSALPNAVNAEGDVVRGAASLSGVVYVMPVNEDGSAVATVNVNSHAVTNAGTFATQVDGSALTALQKIDDPVLVDDAAFTPATSSVMMAGFQADESSTDSVDEGDAGAGRMTLDRKVIVNPQPHTAGGLSIFRSLDLDETEEDVKTSAGQVYGWAVTNTATTTRWLKFYNATAANVTVGSTTPVITWGIPGNSSDDVAANALGGMGIAFDTAICVAATTGVADADTGAPSANDLIVNIFYK